MATKFTNKVLTSAFTRVFLIEGRARADHAPSYESCMRMQGISQGFGDIERIECPDPYKYGGFIEVATIKGTTERPTVTLESRYLADALSDLLRMAKEGCTFDVQLHIGDCQDPSIFNDFSKILVFENSSLTNYGTDELGALGSDENAVVNETADLSGQDVYELISMFFATQAASIVVNEVLDVVVCDSVACGECEDESAGCNKIFALTKAAGGSPATLPDIVFSVDKGTTWYAHDIESLVGEPNKLDCVGVYIVVVSEADGALHYALKSEFNSYTDPDFTQVTTGFVGGGGPRAIWSAGNKAFIVGSGGYVYTTTDPTAGVTAVSAGAAVVDNLLDVHGISEAFAVAVGNNGAVIYTEDGDNWAAATRPVGAGVHLNAVWVKGERDWFVGTSTGRLYYSLDKGVTWTEKAFPGSGSGSVRAISFANNSVGFLSHDTVTPRGRILRTIDGGYSWYVLPETGAMPLTDRFNALAACAYDPNFVVGVSLADDGSDGALVVGTAA